MFVKQLSIFMENKPGRLADLSELLADNGIDLRAISIADTKEFGIVRIIVDDLEKAVSVLENDGWVFKVTPVIAVIIPDKAGRMADVLRGINDAGIAVEYIYAVISHKGNSACKYQCCDQCLLHFKIPFFTNPYSSSSLRTLMNASCGTSTEPT